MPRLREFRTAFRELAYVARPLSFVVFSVVLGIIATLRTFGFDSLKDLYPADVADGWGIWHWAAHIGLDFSLYLFIFNFAIAALIFAVAIPTSRSSTPFLLSSVTVLYYIFWFLFGQARYGMALALLAFASMSESIPVFIACGTLAFLVHKGVIGGVLLLGLWRVLRRRKHGLLIAILIAGGLFFAIRLFVFPILALVGYSAYGGWVEDLPSALTPLKYYYLLLVLLLGAVGRRAGTRSLIILTLLFLPLAYITVFAGRSYQLYAVLLFSALMENEYPGWMHVLILVPFIADIASLIFTSGYYL